jgi:CDGSH-type Zn-finger protein
MILITILALGVLTFVGKLIYDVQQNKNKPTQTEDGFDKDTFQKLAGIKPYSTASLNLPTNVTTKKLNEQIVEALLKAAENSEFPKPDESINVRTAKIGTIDTNFDDNDPLATIPMSRISNEGKKKMAEIAKEDIKVTTKAKAAKLASIFPDVIEYTDEYSKPDYSNVAKCGCGRSETGFCTGLHKIPKKAWAEGVRDIPAEKPKRKYTKNKTK